MIIVCRFTGTRTLSETAEGRAQKAVAITFFLLSPYIAYDAITALTAGDQARTSWLGIGLSITSLAVMPALGIAKRRLGARAAACYAGETSGAGQAGRPQWARSVSLACTSTICGTPATCWLRPAPAWAASRRGWGTDSARAAMIYQHATAEADRMIADALNKRIEDSGKAANPGPDDEDGTAGTLAKTG